MPTELPLEDKLHFLQSADACPLAGPWVDRIETHMSWVFLSKDRVLKLKKPVRYPFLDFSTVERREFFCREEVRLNARLAADVYLGLVALQVARAGWSLVPEGRLSADAATVDWMVLMRRLPARHMLTARIAEGSVAARDLDALAAVLGRFYQRAEVVRLSPRVYIERLQHEQAIHREVLLKPQFALPGASRALDAFDAALSVGSGALQERAAGGHLVDGHGDLRPEHVCLLDEPVVIDCLEFNEALRQVDPWDEIAFLGLECDMAGAPAIGPELTSRLEAFLGEPAPSSAMRLYRAQRALLRARLSMAHLLEPVVRTPQRWPVQAQRYIDLALHTLQPT